MVILPDLARALASEDMLDLVIRNAHAVSMGAWRSFGFVLIAAVLILVYRKGKLPLAIAGWGLALAASVDSWTILSNYWVFSPPASITYRSNAAIDYVKQDSIQSRVLALEIENNPRRDTDLQGDGLMIHRVRTVLGYHGNQLGRYNQILQKDDGFPQVFNPRVWQLYNIRYLLTNTGDVSQYFPGTTRVVGPVVDAAGTPVWLYRLPGENPFAWVTPVTVKADDASVGNTILNPGFDPRSAALFAPDADVASVDALTALPAPLGITARVTQYSPGSIKLELSDRAPAGSSLVVSENYFPGWTARADGVNAAVGRADFTLIGVQLPEGARSIELTFDDPAYERGKTVTLIALALTALLIGWGIFTERKAIA
jgi:hypothetical protein